MNRIFFKLYKDRLNIEKTYLFIFVFLPFQAEGQIIPRFTVLNTSAKYEKIDWLVIIKFLNFTPSKDGCWKPGS
jgi:hypothetical protein